ncbi:UNVERIFIED_CONTAM: hypothetical protein K2H54_024579 [Gekko kuhli]
MWNSRPQDDAVMAVNLDGFRKETLWKGSVMDEQCGNQQDLQNGLHIFSLVTYNLVFLLGIIGNGVVISILGFCMKKTVNTIWFLNLAIADFTFILLLPLSIASLAQNNQWLFGEAMCKINSFITLVNLHASVYFLTIISVDRYISVLFPVWARNHRTLRRASFVALGVWILSLALSSPNLHFRKIQNGTAWCSKIYSSNEAEEKIIHHAVVITQFILTFAIPFSVIAVCYGAIILRLRRDRLALSSKPFKVITAVIAAFFVCWFPYQVFTLLEILAYKDQKLDCAVYYFYPSTFTLALINSCLNPILYVFMGRDVQKGLKRSILAVFENALSEETSRSTTQERMTDTSLRMSYELPGETNPLYN